MRWILLVGCFLLSSAMCFCRTLDVGPGRTYESPVDAANDAAAGDSILIHASTYHGTFWIENLHGTEQNWITIVGVDPGTVVFSGGTESMHFSECSFLHIRSFTVTEQTGNGMNIDDGGSYDTPAHHIIIEDVRFVQMAASGNNDMLKLSGLDDFVIRNCSFVNGAAGGSGIDMVGCHHGTIAQNHFESMGSNAIQAKGGTQHIRIERNAFVNAGARSLNLGGSTGLDFFRPLDAPFEAADLQVYANTFDGSQTPFAYVGSVRVDVANNLIRNPGKWVFRILQETTEPSGRFAECGDNVFRNNVVLYSQSAMPTVNIGPNTRPESFTVSHNLCFGADGVTTSPLDGYPFEATQSIVGRNPQIDGDCPLPTSPVHAVGVVVPELHVDLQGKPWGIPPSIGACEVDSPTEAQFTNNTDVDECFRMLGYTADGVVVTVHEQCAPLTLNAYSITGALVEQLVVPAGFTHLPMSSRWMLLVPATTSQMRR